MPIPASDDKPQGTFPGFVFGRSSGSCDRTKISEVEQAAQPVDAAALSGEVLFPYDNPWMRHVWDRARNHLGFASDEHFVPYICRHTCASRLVQRGVPINVVKEWMGHKSITMTMRYAHLAPSNLKAAAGVLEDA